MKTITSVDVFAPATVANIGIGFDILGLALREPGDVVRAQWHDSPGITLLGIEGDGGKLPRAIDKNTATVAASHLLKTIHSKRGVAITVYKHLPLASGLGSSAASAVAAAVAVNKLFGDPLTKGELLPACLEGEAAVSGYHADNVAPALFGGITLVTGTNADQIQQLPIPAGVYLAMVTPDVAVPTALARAALPKEILLKAMVAQTAGVAKLVDALHRGDVQAMAEAMELDGIVEPARAHLMPLLAEMRIVAKAAGALALVISGAGPTLCAVCDSQVVAQRVAAAMKARYDEAGIKSIAQTTIIAEEGARVVASE